MITSKSPIVVFDSGVGGISVLKRLWQLMPNEDYIYFGDSKNAPYGVKPTGEIRELTIKNAEMLMNRGAKALVIACKASAATRQPALQPTL